MESRLFREHELAFRTQYAELKERTLAAGDLLPGTPGSLALRSGTGYPYWYRVLAGNQCIPIRLPQAARFVWHKLYSSTQRSGFPEKAAKDQQQALVLGAVLAETDPVALRDAGKEAPAAMLDPVRPFFDTLLRRVGGHPELSDVLRECLGGDRS